MSDQGAPALECRGVGMCYGAVTALNDVSLGFAAGQIHAVVGQNGAGKTTFARVCAGIVRPTAGSIHVNGVEIAPGDVRHARAAGVELVHQSFALPSSFTMAEAMEFGSTRRSGPIFSRRGLEARWQDHLRKMGVAAPLRARIGTLPIETRQAVEIARALVSDARVLILDEPTSVLSPRGIRLLFERIRRLREDGVTVLLILHKIHEVLDIAETVTVLRGGKLVAGPIPERDWDADRLAQAIIGTPPEAMRGVSPGDGATEAIQGFPRRPSVLQMDDVRTRGSAGECVLDGVSIEVEAGRIIGLAGVEGNGQRTLVGALASRVKLDSGHIRIAGKDVNAAPLLERRAAGLRIIPFERNIDGLSLSTSLWENWAVHQLLSGSLLRLIAPARLRRSCREALDRWSVHFSSVDQPAGSLSGGNAQKIILAREVNQDAALIVAAQPTRGLDIGATAFVWRSLREARERGAGVLLISSDLDELFDISDRIVVMLSGRIVGEFTPPYSLDAVGKAMTGASP